MDTMRWKNCSANAVNIISPYMFSIGRTILIDGCTEPCGAAVP